MGFRNPLTLLSELVADSITGATITGGLIRTAVSGERIEITTTFQNMIRFFSGITGSSAGYIEVDALEDSYTHLTLKAPSLPGGSTTPPKILMESATAGTGGDSIWFQDSIVRVEDGLAFTTDAGAQVIHDVTYGQATVAVNGAGEANIAHNMGVAPTVVQVTPRAVNQRTVSVVARGATNFTIKVWIGNGSLLANGDTIPVDWLAIR